MEFNILFKSHFHNSFLIAGSHKFGIKTHNKVVGKKFYSTNSNFEHLLFQKTSSLFEQLEEKTG